MEKIGVVHGRFQILHLDHIKYILEAKHHCERLIVGISNPDEMHTSYEKENPHRSQAINNFMTYFERYEMIRLALLAEGLNRSEFEIVPFPINMPDLLHHYVPKEALFFLSIYDSWGEKKLEMLNHLGYRTKVLWRVSLEEKGISSSEIRSKILSGESIKEFVSESVFNFINSHRLDEVLREIAKVK